MSVVGESLNGEDGGDDETAPETRQSSGPTFSRPTPPPPRTGPPLNVNPSFGTGGFGLAGGDGNERSGGGSASTGFAGDRNNS